MPNWCHNEIALATTSTAQYQWLTEILKSGVSGIFEAIYPVPEDSNENRVKAWGTKWDVYPEGTPLSEIRPESEIYSLQAQPGPNGGGWASFECQTPSNPPVGVLSALVANGFDVTCRYAEPNMSFFGEWDNGYNESYEAEEQDEDVIPASRSALIGCEALAKNKCLVFEYNRVMEVFEVHTCGVTSDGYEAIRGWPVCCVGGGLTSDWTTLRVRDLSLIGVSGMQSDIKTRGAPLDAAVFSRVYDQVGYEL